MPSESGEFPVRRLHPLSLLFSVGALAKSLLLPGIVVLAFASSGGRGELWFMLLFIPSLAGALFQYWSFRYRFDREELVVREGIVFHNERHIPYARIQNIDLVQNPLHRLFRVAEVRLETAGGQKPEAVMRVLSLDAVRFMRERIFEREHSSGEPEGAAASAESLHEMRSPEVILFGLISNKGLVVVAAAMGLLWQFDLFDWEEFISSRESLARLVESVPQSGLVESMLVALAAIVLFLVAVRLLSVLWAFAKFHDFRLTLRGDDLRADYGLFPRVSKTIPRHRIQVLSMHSGFLHRRCGRAVVQVETAGSAGEQQPGNVDRLWLAPLMRADRVNALLRDVLPEVDLATLEWQPVSRRARWRLFRRGLYFTALVTAAAVTATVVAGFGGWGLVAALVFAPLAWLHAKLWVEHTAYALVPGAICFKTGWWKRRMRVARFTKIQSLQRGESPFDRRQAMASVRVDTAGAMRAGYSIDVRYLDEAVAVALTRRLYAEAGRTAFRW